MSRKFNSPMRLRWYRRFQSAVIGKWVLPRLVSAKRAEESRKSGIHTLAANHEIEARAQGAPASRRYWFHAASVGELESLWSVIALLAESKTELILTVFSESAAMHLQRQARTLAGKPGRILYAGYSPWEGAWIDSLEKLRPEVFITAKYEAWPELWCSLSELRIPLVIVSAKARRSLKVAKQICQLLGVELPKMLLLSQTESNSETLRKLFPGAQVLREDDPRWDRVAQRAGKGSDRVKELEKLFHKLPRPWGVLGSAWMSDLSFWRRLGKPPALGTLWIVPHKTDSKSILELQIQLKDWGLTPIISTDPCEIKVSDQFCVLIDEMGFLSELYSLMDWAYVGGGFGSGVHSTIEPAIQGIPIAAGPEGVLKFDEIDILRQSQQLTLLKTPEELKKWLEARFQARHDPLSGLSPVASSELPKATSNQSAETGQAQVWKSQVASRLGASARVRDFIDSLLT